MGKKIIYFIVTLLEAALLAGAYMINYFTVRKLGMVRWVNARCIKWEKIYPVSQIKMAVIVLLLLLAFITIWLYIKQRARLKKMAGVMTITMIILTTFALGYILLSSFLSRRAYYFVSMMSALAALLQILKTLVGFKVCCNEY